MSPGTSRVTQTLQRYVEQELVAGIVAVVADEERIRSCDTLGDAEIATGRPMADDTSRQPMPAGGLFSSPSDLVAFYRMVLRKGRHGTTRILSEAAVDTMTQRHTPPNLEASYGFGWAVGDGTIGHGGAYSTLSTIHLGPGLITIFLVQQDGFAPGGDRCASDFEEAAVA